MKLIKILILVITILFTFSCEDKDKEITDIKLNDYEHKQDVDDFSISDILLIIEYDDNSFNQICITKDMIDENDLSKLNNLGKHNIKVNYKNFDIYLDIELTDYYKVDFIVDNEVINTQEVEHGKDAILPNVEKEGFVFLGWDKEGTNITKDTTIVGSYELNKYEVKFIIDNKIVDVQMVEHGKDAILPATDRKGYEFLGWSNDGKNITNNTVIYGSYEIKINSLDNSVINEIIGNISLYNTELTYEYYNIINKIQYSRENKLYLYNFISKDYYYIAYYEKPINVNQVQDIYEGYVFESKETIQVKMNDGLLSHIFIVQEGTILKNLFKGKDLNQDAIHINYMNYDIINNEIIFKNYNENPEEFAFWAFEEDINEYKDIYNINYSIIECITKTKSPSEKYEIIKHNNEEYIYFRIGESQNEEIINQLTNIRFGEYANEIVGMCEGYVIDNNITYLSLKLNDFINWIFMDA